MRTVTTLSGIDHIHVFVADRVAAAAWYREVLGFVPVAALGSWAVDGGPLTLGDADGTVHLALFEAPRQACRSTVALGCAGSAFLAWRAHLRSALGREVTAEDHALSWSLYFEDPDGNPFEITSYDHDEVRARLGGA